MPYRKNTKRIMRKSLKEGVSPQVDVFAFIFFKPESCRILVFSNKQKFQFQYFLTICRKINVKAGFGEISVELLRIVVTDFSRFREATTVCFALQSRKSGQPNKGLDQFLNRAFLLAEQDRSNAMPGEYSIR